MPVVGVRRWTLSSSTSYLPPWKFECQSVTRSFFKNKFKSKSYHLWLALVKMAYVQIYKNFAYRKLWSKWQALYFYIYWFDIVLKLILVPSLTYFEFMKVNWRKTFLWVKQVPSFFWQVTQNPCTSQKMKFSIKDFFSKCDQIIFTEEILNWKLHFLFSGDTDYW